MTYVLVGVLAGCVLLFGGGFFLGRELRLDRAERRARMQESLDRCSRTAALASPEQSYGRFPADADTLTFGEISSGWDHLEAEQRGWGW